MDFEIHPVLNCKELNFSNSLIYCPSGKVGMDIRVLLITHFNVNAQSNFPCVWDHIYTLCKPPVVLFLLCPSPSWVHSPKLWQYLYILLLKSRNLITFYCLQSFLTHSRWTLPMHAYVTQALQWSCTRSVGKTATQFGVVFHYNVLPFPKVYCLSCLNEVICISHLFDLGVLMATYVLQFQQSKDKHYNDYIPGQLVRCFTTTESLLGPRLPSC